MGNYNLNLGNFAGQLSLNDSNRAAQSIAGDSAAGSAGASNADVSSAAKSQQPSGWDQTQKYLGAVGNLGSDDGQQKNGLQKVMGLVGLFV